ncbi:MAG: hypothetical protein LUE06_00545 [Oscillospiraceae bacterium]|nr:hypothetical protein [Oscillospiraceae bacterium]
MGFLDIFNTQPSTPTVPSVLPDIAKQQILRGRLPTLQPNNLLLRNGELCHYADRAIYEKRTVSKRRVRKNRGYSMPGLLNGTSMHFGGGESEFIEDEKFSTIKGVLYVTNERIIFVAEHDGFDRKTDDLIAVTPYVNCIELQFSKETLKLFVPDGNLLHNVLRLI